jgi:hypothetical protein
VENKEEKKMTIPEFGVDNKPDAAGVYVASSVYHQESGEPDHLIFVEGEAPYLKIAGVCSLRDGVPITQYVNLRCGQRIWPLEANYMGEDIT